MYRSSLWRVRRCLLLDAQSSSYGDEFVSAHPQKAATRISFGVSKKHPKPPVGHGQYRDSTKGEIHGVLPLAAQPQPSRIPPDLYREMKTVCRGGDASFPRELRHLEPRRCQSPSEDRQYSQTLARG